MACGRIDERVSSMAFWSSAFGQPMSAEQTRDAHPLRRLEGPNLASRGEATAAESDLGWAMLKEGFGVKV